MEYGFYRYLLWFVRFNFDFRRFKDVNNEDEVLEEVVWRSDFALCLKIGGDL